jgi:RNA 3'-terminal phosphate cyclase (ATP)
LLVYELSDGRVVGSDAIGERSKSAEMVGTEAAERFAGVVDSGACVDSNLADMLAPVLALARHESRLRIPRPTSHLETNLHVARLFTGCEFHVDTDGASSILAIIPRTRR